MPTVAMSGNDTVTINNTVITDLADTNVVELTFPTEIAQLKVGKNGNSIYGLNESGKAAEVKLRVIRGSKNDKFLNSLLTLQNANFAGFPLMIGEFIKKIGDGSGNITSDIYVMSGGIFTKFVEGKSNVEGDTEQSVSIYMMKFSNAPRALT
jgi:hypothetical protein